MVRFMPETPQAVVDAILAEHDLTLINLIPGIDVYVLQTRPHQANPTVVHLNKLAEVKYAELVGVAQGDLTPTDQDYNNPKGLSAAEDQRADGLGFHHRQQQPGRGSAGQRSIAESS